MVCTGWPSGAYGPFEPVQKSSFPLVNLVISVTLILPVIIIGIIVTSSSPTPSSISIYTI
jgi:hypothetical protein